MNVTTVNAPAKSNSLMPTCITELFTAANELSLAATAACRTIRITVEGLEHVVVGLEEVSTLALSAQRKRLLAELEEA